MSEKKISTDSNDLSNPFEQLQTRIKNHTLGEDCTEFAKDVCDIRESLPPEENKWDKDGT